MPMSKIRRRQIRFALAVVFLVLLPLKYVILSTIGTEITGRVVLLSTACESATPIKSKPYITAVFFTGETKQEIEGKAGYGNPEFCDLRIGDGVKISYLEAPKTSYILSTIGNPRRILFAFVFGGILVNVLGNLVLTLLKWEDSRRLRRITSL